MPQLRKTSTAFIRRSAMVAALTLAFAGGAHANLIVDGGFEGDGGGRTPNNGSYAAGSTYIPGWTVTEPSGPYTGYYNVQWISSGSYSSITAYDGVGLIDLTGNPDYGPSGLAQTFATIANTAYQVTFHIGYGDPTQLFGGPVSVNVSTDGGPGQTFVVTGPGTAGQTTTTWTEFTYNFTAASTSTLLSFSGVTGDHYLGLDGIDVELAPAIDPAPVGGTSVPEPAPIALLGLGLIGGVFARRRSKAALPA
jgi:hypothetical protein